MKKNYLLFFADILCKILIWTTILAGILLVLIFIHLQINPGFYQNVTLHPENDHINFKIEPHLIQKQSFAEWNKSGDRVYYLNRLTLRTEIYLTFYHLIKQVIFLVILFQVQKFIRSIKNYSTFHSNNVKVFMNIGFCFLLLFIIQIFPSLTTFDMKFADRPMNFVAVTWNFQTKFLILFIFSFILSEVFREGNKLKEENELTI